MVMRTLAKVATAGFVLVVVACAAEPPPPPSAVAAPAAASIEEAPMRTDITAASITLRVGQVLELSAPAELGAGFSWAVTETPSILTQQGEAGLTRDPAGEGGKDHQVFTFRATKPGAGELALVYRRPWESSAAPRDQRRIPVTVVAN